MLRARLFDGMSVEIDGRPVPPIASSRARALLAYMLLNPGPHPRSRLAGRFWPDVMDASALASLRSALWALRRALDEAGGAAYLVADRRTAGIAADLPREVDAERFGVLVGSDDPADLEAAAALATGPLLPDLTDEWALAAQDEARERLVQALERLGDAAERAGDLPAATAWARAAVGHDRLRESAHRALIRRLAMQGRRDGALAAYRRCRAALAAELGVAPSAETRALAAGLEAPDEGRALARAAGRAPAGALLGRDDELGALRRAWDGARAGRGGVAVLTGVAGIGKTRLAEELAAHAAAAGGRHATGAALELEGAPPFAAWSEALAALVAAVPEPPADAAWPAELARLCPAAESAWGRRPPAPAAAPDLERARLFEAVVALVAWGARDAPLLMALEDLHLADSAALALLAYAGRRLPGMDALVLVTRRGAVVNAGLEVALEGLRRRDAVRAEVALGPLAPAALRRLAAAAAPGLPADDRDRAARLAEGNPLLATAAARSLLAGDDPAEGLRAAVRGPLARLPVAARLVADLLAVAGRPLAPAELAVPVGAEALPGAIAAGAEAGLLAAGDDRRVAFRHALIREACAAELPPGRRAWVHGALAAALAARPRPAAAEVARHLRGAGDAEGARARLEAAAAAARALGALDEAARYLDEAVALDEAGPAPAELLLALAGVEAWRGRREASDAAFARAEAAFAVARDARGLAEAHVARGGWLRTTLCVPGEALAAYGRARDVIADEGLDAPELTALALAGSAWSEAIAGDPERVEALVAGAEAVPETAGDRVLAAELALARAAGLARRGRMADAEAHYADAAALARRAGRGDLAHVAWANAASAAACRGDFARALAVADAVPGDGARDAGPVLAAFVEAARAHALARLGRSDEAAAAAEAAAALTARSGDPAREAGAELDLGAVALAGGRPAAAARHLQAALAGPGRAVPRPLARLLLAEARLETEGPDAAEAELGRVPFEPVGAADLPDTLVARMARLQGRVAAARGDIALALRRYDEAERVWRRRLGVAAEGDLFAATLVDLGRPPVGGLVEPGVELGRVLADRADALRAAGRAAEARAAGEEALALADELRFDGYRARLADATGAHA